MHNALRVARKELATFFSSLAAFIFIGVFLAVSLFIFFWVERFFARNIADVRPLFEWMPLLLIFLVSALTMRMWSEERRAGTLEFLMTTPIKPWELALGKFLACLGLVGMALALTLPVPLTVAHLGPLDWGPVIGGYVATLALAAAYISVGLFVSARTDSQIVSLIVTALICSAFYLLGSDALTSLFGYEWGETLRLFGSGSRFESIARGVIDLRDLYYYLSIFGVFLVLNLYSLERLRWSEEGQREKHFRWRLAAGLAIANLVAANAWLGQLGWARADLTEGRIYSLSSASRAYLKQLQEPLLIRGYFSAQTHPLLAPLAPRLRDLLKEYEVAGGGKVRVEFVDPLREPELEEEANRRYNIKPVPFQTSSKYQASVTNSYFNILVQYGDEYETLGYQDLIEIKQTNESELDVDLRDPEYEITRAIKKALYSYRGGGNVFEAIPKQVRLEAYVSGKDKLPDPLPQLKTDLEALISNYKAEAGDKFVAEFKDPDAEGGQIAKQLQETYGLRPLAVGLLNPKQFWFHLLLVSDGKATQVPLPENLDKENLKRNIEAELKRFTPGALRTIALYTPPSNPMAAQMRMAGMDGPNFQLLEDKLRENAMVQATDLSDGHVPEQADILFVAAPENLDEKQLFAIDQFLMKGGTVVIASSPFKPYFQDNMSVAKTPSGLKNWLEHNGLAVEETLVLDPQNAAFPLPVQRNVGGFQVSEVRLFNYPYFVDVRQDGLADGMMPTAGLEQLTLSWAAPVKVNEEKAKGRKIERLIESSPQSWTSGNVDVTPDFRQYPRYGFEPGKDAGRKLLGVMMEGQFASYFAGKPSPLAKDAKPESAEKKEGGDAAAAEESGKEAGKDAQKAEAKPTITGVIDRSPESARIILIGSGSFLSDEVLNLTATVDRTQYLAPVRFAENLIDWSLEDRELLALRSRGGKFSRTLLPMGGAQAVWEYLNYAFALAGLAAIYGGRRYRQAAVRRRYVAMLSTKGA